MIKNQRVNKADFNERHCKFRDQLAELHWLANHEFLVQHGFRNPKRNLNALIQKGGDRESALIYLQNSKEPRHRKRDDIDNNDEDDDVDDAADNLNNQNQERFQHYQSNVRVRLSYAERIAAKQKKYDEKLDKTKTNKQFQTYEAQLDYFSNLGYDHKVNVFKLLLKFNGDQNTALNEIKTLSERNPNKFRIPSSKLNDDSDRQDQLGSRNKKLGDEKRLFNKNSGQIDNQRGFKQKREKPQHKKQDKYQNENEPIPTIQLGQPLIPQNSLDNHKQEFITDNIDQNIDRDALEQMQRSKEEEESKANFQAPSSSEVNDYIKKNQYLIANGFMKASQNMNALVRANGNQETALQILIENQLKKSRISIANKDAQKIDGRRKDVNNSDSDDDSD